MLPHPKKKNKEWLVHIPKLRKDSSKMLPAGKMGICFIEILSYNSSRQFAFPSSCHRSKTEVTIPIRVEAVARAILRKACVKEEEM